MTRDERNRLEHLQQQAATLRAQVDAAEVEVVSAESTQQGLEKQVARARRELMTRRIENRGAGAIASITGTSARSKARLVVALMLAAVWVGAFWAPVPLGVRTLMAFAVFIAVPEGWRSHA